MRRLGPSLYIAALLLATPAAALSPDAVSRLEAARSGEMTRLVFHDTPRERIEVPFDDAEGNPVRFADWEGDVVFVNFWATWCPPCLKEMPAIDRLSAAMAGEIAVLAISTDRGDPEKPRRWLAENGIENLALYHDRALRTAAASAILGQPTTLVLDRQGREIARYQGDAEWDSPEAQAILRAIVDELGAGG